MEYIPVWNMHDTMSDDEFMEELIRRMPVSEGTVHGLLTEIKQIIQEQLRKGHAVEIGGLGVFGAKIVADSWPTEDVPFDCVKSVKVTFSSKRSFCKDIISNEKENGGDV